jgi:hypothetical protein
MRHNQLLFYANETNLLSENVYTIWKNSVAIFIAANKPGLEVAAEKINHIFLSYQQYTEQNCNIKVGNKSFDNVTKFV